MVEITDEDVISAIDRTISLDYKLQNPKELEKIRKEQEILSSLNFDIP